jgi:hypothetical protein
LSFAAKPQNTENHKDAPRETEEVWKDWNGGELGIAYDGEDDDADAKQQREQATMANLVPCCRQYLRISVDDSVKQIHPILTRALARKPVWKLCKAIRA